MGRDLKEHGNGRYYFGVTNSYLSVFYLRAVYL